MEISAYCADDAGQCAKVYFAAVQFGTAHIYSQAQRDGWCKTCPTAEQNRNRLAGLTTFVAKIDGAVVGYMSVRENDGLLDLAFVHPDFTGHGVAFALYQAVLQRVQHIGLPKMTVVASEPSYRFFSRQGWRVTGREDHGEGAEMIKTWLMDFDVEPVDDGNHD